MELEEYFKNLARKVNISDIASYEFSLALDEDDSLKFLRNEFHYPKMKSLPYGMIISADYLLSLLSLSDIL